MQSSKLTLTSEGQYGRTCQEQKKNLKLKGVVSLFPKDVLNIEIQGESEHKSSISHTF
jgi:outer membrane lipopolysaccharide assembly protein LptE/RlpB